ncbi:MAG: alanine--glyoxylate aminotransferase family protein [Anaerolineales bacterium]
MANLFIPGPTDVHPEVLQAQSRPMIGHRSQACVDLIARTQPKLRTLFGTEQRVFLSTSSGTGLQEASVRNCVSEKLLVCVCGAFGERWFEVAQQNGIPAEKVTATWGQANTPEQVETIMKKKVFDAIAIVHNETSTGVENPIQAIASVARALNPEIIVLVDSVSAVGGVEIRVDDWGLDVVFTSSQKCLALPPGMAFAAVSDRALHKAESVHHRGWYFDFLLYEKFLKRNLTPTTPAISLLFALDAQLDRIFDEGLENRFMRHRDLAARTQAWAKEKFDLYADAGVRSKTVTAVKNTTGLRIAELNQYLATHNMVIANGYGNIKDITFRIGHMGELDLQSLETLIDLVDKFSSQNNQSLDHGSSQVHTEIR